MKVNTDSAIKRNSFMPTPESCSAWSRISIKPVALDITLAGSLPDKGGLLASQEIVRAQDQGSSSIEVFSGPRAEGNRPQLLDWPRNRTRVSAACRSCRSDVAAWRG